MLSWMVTTSHGMLMKNSVVKAATGKVSEHPVVIPTAAMSANRIKSRVQARSRFVVKWVFHA